MTELKKLSPRTAVPQTELNFRQGFNFGMGFMAATLIFSVVIIPALICGTAVVLSMLGASLGGLVPGG